MKVNLEEKKQKGQHLLLNYFVVVTQSWKQCQRWEFQFRFSIQRQLNTLSTAKHCFKTSKAWAVRHTVLTVVQALEARCGQAWSSACFTSSAAQRRVCEHNVPAQTISTASFPEWLLIKVQMVRVIKKISCHELNKVGLCTLLVRWKAASNVMLGRNLSNLL